MSYTDKQGTDKKHRETEKNNHICREIKTFFGNVNTVFILTIIIAEKSLIVTITEKANWNDAWTTENCPHLSNEKSVPINIE